MSERLHYFAEATTPVSFDCDASEIESDLGDLRRPQTDTDRLNNHTRQLQLWSDEARRRLGASVTQSSPTVQRRVTHSSPPPPPPTPPTPDRHQSNLSERARSATSRPVPRSHSAKNLRIRVTPSSSSKSLLSDIESELCAHAAHTASSSAPTSPRLRAALAPPSSQRAPLSQPSQQPHQAASAVVKAPRPQPLPAALVLSPTNVEPVSATRRGKLLRHDNDDDDDDDDSDADASLSRRQSFYRRIKRFSLRRLLRRS
ncbi:unnamed protein product [Agarophyton chilense]|eukprot:gb/GEZJ01000662.1/.p1 GENE.gb/GEZJ01000662.1/~~gb/GEZJ01000662.1/.p1  ORF type:complete len:301 (-),score=44.55 gb/GEZJ01000662.1/:812-1585(-)